jgi:hypothetical protein
MLDEARTALMQAYARTVYGIEPTEVQWRRESFLAKYPPEALVNLSPPDLMRMVHGDEAERGLFYDLEFAEQFSVFGSIAGGSALKFKVYRAGDGSGYKRKGLNAFPTSCSEAEAERLTVELMELIYRILIAAERHELKTGDPSLWRAFDEEVSTYAPPSLPRSGHDSAIAYLG